MTFKDDKELQALDNKSLSEELKKAKVFLNGINWDNQQGNLKDFSQLRKVRRYIAAIRTFSRQRELEQSASSI